MLDKANFRPVTVLPAFNKVFERTVHTQMSGYFDSIVHDFMFAYRKYHGCSAALLTLTETYLARLSTVFLMILCWKSLDFTDWMKDHGHSFGVTSHIAINESNWETAFRRGRSFAVVYLRGQYWDRFFLIFL